MSLIAKLAARPARADLAGLRSAEPLTLARSSRSLLVCEPISSIRHNLP